MAATLAGKMIKTHSRVDIFSANEKRTESAPLPPRFFNSLLRLLILILNGGGGCGGFHTVYFHYRPSSLSLSARGNTRCSRVTPDEITYYVFVYAKQNRASFIRGRGNVGR